MHVGGSSWCVQYAVADTITWIGSRVRSGVGPGRTGPCLELEMTIQNTVFHVYFVLYDTVRYWYVSITLVASDAHA